MTPRQVEYIKAIVEHGTMRRACTQLYVAEATLSAQVKKLEEELNITLFYQSRERGRPLRLTDAGKQLLPDLEFYLQVHNDIFRRAESIREQAEQREKAEASHA